MNCIGQQTNHTLEFSGFRPPDQLFCSYTRLKSTRDAAENLQN